MKTVKTEVTRSKTTSTLDLSEELQGLTKRQREEALTEVGELLVEQTLSRVASERSPLEGYGKFQALSKEYGKKKLEETGSKAANLDLSGEMLSSLEFDLVGKDRIEIGIYGSDAPKADGHNNLSGDSSLPLRRFLPGEEDEYDKSIQAMVRETIAQYKGDNLTINAEVLDDISTSGELYSELEAIFGEMSRAELKRLVLGSELRSLLDEYDLLSLL